MTKTEERGVRFVPSRVDGVSGVREVAVFADRLEMLGGRGWVSVPFADIARHPIEPPTIFERLFRVDRYRPPVIGIRFSKERYTDSHIRVLTEPPITLYMPADGPTQFPDSTFAQILQRTRAGDYGYRD